MVRFCRTFLTTTAFLLGRIQSTDQNGSWNIVGEVSRVEHGKQKNMSKKAKFKPGAKKRENKCIVMFDDKHRQ